MIEFTYDPDARTLYAYFASIDEGQDSEQIEYDGFFLLDKAGQILGMHVDLGIDHHPRLLHFALDHDEVVYDQRSRSVRIIFSSEQPGSHVDFSYPAIFDLDRNGHALGVEFIADPAFELHTRLRHVRPYIVEVFGSDEDDGGGEFGDDGGSGIDASVVDVGPHATDPAAAVEPASPADDISDGAVTISSSPVRAGFVA